MPPSPAAVVVSSVADRSSRSPPCSPSVQAVHPLSMIRSTSGTSYGAPKMPRSLPIVSFAMYSSGMTCGSTSLPRISLAEVMLRIGWSTGSELASVMTKTSASSLEITSPDCSAHAGSTLEVKTPAIAAPAISSTPRASPPTMERPGRAGSTSRPPGAPETKAVTSRRRLNE